MSEQLTLTAARAHVVPPIRPKGLPIADAARYLGVSRWTVQRLRSKGEIAGYHVGAAAMIDLASMDAYVERHGG